MSILARSDEYVDYLFRRCSEDKGFRADLRRADNPSFEWRVWPVIMSFAGKLDSDMVRRSYALIGSAIGKSRQASNGEIRIGKAFRVISKGKSENKQFPPRLIRFLSCDDLLDLIAILRPTLSYMISEGIALDFKCLLKDLLAFRYEENRDRIKAAWAADYLGAEGDNDNE